MNFSQFGTSWEQGIDFHALRAYRVERLRRACEEEKLDALLLFKHDNIRYLASYRPLMWSVGYITRNAAAFVPGGELILFAQAGDADRAMDAMPWVGRENIYRLGSLEDPGIAQDAADRLFSKVLDGINAKSGRVGVDATTLYTMEALEKRFPQITFVPAEPALRRAREIKSEEELKVIWLSAAISEGAMDAMVRTLRVGVRTFDVSSAGVEAIFGMGAEYVPQNLIVAPGSYAAPFHPFTPNTYIAFGDPVILEAAAIHDGYCSRVGRTRVIGKPHWPEQERVFNDVLQAHQSMLDGCKAHRAPRELVETGERSLQRWRDRGATTYATVAGIGLGMIDFPRADSDRPLQPGMVVTVETGVHLPGAGAARLVDTVVINESGAQVQTNNPYELEVR